MSIRFVVPAILLLIVSLSACTPAATTDESEAPPVANSTPPPVASAPPPTPEPTPPPAPIPPTPPPPGPAPPPSDEVISNRTALKPLDSAAIARAEAAISTPDLWFETAATIDALSFGLVGDGVTDNTEVFRRLLAGGNRTIHVPAGDYVTHKLDIAPNTILVLEAGVVIRDAGRLDYREALLNIRSTNVAIIGSGARVIADRSRYTSGEYRHGILIFGASRVLIDGLESSGHGGDGVYVGGPPGQPATDVRLRGCRADNNRRQGLSITSARRVQVIDCEFMDTNGTAPEYGIDIEPNEPVDFADEIVLVRARTRANRGGGLMIHLPQLDSTSSPVEVIVIDHSSEAESTRLWVDAPPGVRATVRYGRT